LFGKDRYVVCNGFKPKNYINKIAGLINNGFKNVIPVFDNWYEPDLLSEVLKKPTHCGIRLASEEEPKFEFYTSRLGIGYKDVLAFYKDEIKDNKRLKLKMLHFFINTGIKDTAYYWSELLKAVKVYCELKKICPTLNSLNMCGGLPIKNSLSFSYDYEYMIEEIVRQIKSIAIKKAFLNPISLQSLAATP
jgi:arginine decarboxylase